MDIDLSILGAHKFGAQIKSLLNYCQWQKAICKLWLLIEMKTCQDVFIIFFIVNVYSTLSAANIAILMNGIS